MKTALMLSLLLLASACNVSFKGDDDGNKNNNGNNPSLTGGSSTGGEGGGNGGSTAGATNGSTNGGSTSGSTGTTNGGSTAGSTSGGVTSGSTNGSTNGGTTTTGVTSGTTDGGVTAGSTSGGTTNGTTNGGATSGSTNGSTNGGSTSGSTTGATNGGTTAGTTNGSATGGVTSGSTSGSTNGGSTSGTTGTTSGVTGGSTDGGVTAGATSGSTNGGSTAGSTSGTTAGGSTAGTTSGGTTAGSTGSTSGGTTAGTTSGGTTSGTTGTTNGGTTAGAPPVDPPGGSSSCIDEIPAGINITNQINSDWTSGYTYQVQVTNNTGANLTNWTLCFYYNQNVGNEGIWNAEISNQSVKPTWKLLPKSYNKTIYSGSNVTINWNASPGGLNGQKIKAIKFLNQENATCLPINCQTTPVCTTAQVANSTAVSSSSGSCIATACSENYQVQNGQCVPKSCTCASVPYSSAVSGDLVSGCVATSCLPNYMLNGGACVPVNCTSQNVANSVLVSGTLASGCVATSCLPNYMLVAGMCMPGTCSTANVNNSSAVSGNLISGCVATSCQAGYVLLNGTCTPGTCSVASVPNATSVAGNTISGCVATGCKENYSLANGSCNPTTCSISNVLNSSSVSGNLVSGCIATNCKTNYTLNNGACNPSTCSISNVANSLAVSGNLVSGCVATSCKPNYTLNNGACSPTTCSASNVTNSLSVSGTLVSGCVATSCKPGFSVQNGQCVGNACTTANVLNSTAVSGTLDTVCVATACSSGFNLTNGACVPKQTCSATGAEKVVNGMFNNPTIANSAGWDLFSKNTTSNFGWDVRWVNNHACGSDSVEPKLELQNFIEHQFDDVTQVAELDTDCQGPSGNMSFSNKETNVIIEQNLDLVVGKTYRLTYYMKSRTGTTSSQAVVRLGHKHFKIKNSQVSSTSWKKFEHTVTINSGDIHNHKVKLSIKGKGLGDSFGMLVAKVSVKEINHCPPSPQAACTSASQVVSYSPVNPVAASRQLATRALGVAIPGDVEEFVSLGFGGQIVLKLDAVLYNRPGKDLKINETSYGNRSFSSYPEQALVEVSMDGVAWSSIGTVKNDNDNSTINELDLGSIPQALYVRITDTSVKASFGASDDGFDVESLLCLNQEVSQDLYYLDNHSDKIYKVQQGVNQVATSFYVNSPYSLAAIALNSEATKLYVLESTSNNRLSYVNTQTGSIVSLGHLNSCATFYSLAMGPENDRLYAIATNSRVYSIKLSDLAVTDLGLLKNSSGSLIHMSKGDLHIHQGKMYVATAANGGQLFAVDKVGSKLVATKMVEGLGDVTGLTIYQKNQLPTFLFSIGNSNSMLEYNSSQGKVNTTVTGSISQTMSTGDLAGPEAIDIDYYQ